MDLVFLLLGDLFGKDGRVPRYHVGMSFGYLDSQFCFGPDRDISSSLVTFLY